MHLSFFYPHQGGYVLPSICLSVCPIGTSHKTSDWIFVKFYQSRFWTRKPSDPDMYLDARIFTTVWWGNSAYFADNSRTLNFFFWGGMSHKKKHSILLLIQIMIQKFLNRFFLNYFSIFVITTLRFFWDQQPCQRFVLSECSFAYITQKLWINPSLYICYTTYHVQLFNHGLLINTDIMYLQDTLYITQQQFLLSKFITEAKTN